VAKSLTLSLLHAIIVFGVIITKKNVKTSTENNSMVFQSNELSQQICSTLSVHQYRLLYLLVSHVKPTDTEFQFERFYLYDLCKLLKIPLGGREYKALIDSLTEIGKQVWWMYRSDTGGIHMVSWFDYCEVLPLLNTVKLRLNYNLLPHLTQLKQCFTAFELNTILNFKSKYSIRFYTLCKSWQGKGEFSITLEKLKAILNCNYNKYADIVRRVLQPAETEINEKSDIAINWQPITAEGKKTVIGLIIHVSQSEKNQQYDNAEPTIFLDPS